VRENLIQVHDPSSESPLSFEADTFKDFGAKRFVFGIYLRNILLNFVLNLFAEYIADLFAKYSY